MITVFTPQITPRISYIFEWFLGELVGTEFTLTADLEEFRSNPHPKFAYASSPVADEFWFGASGLLTETGVHEMAIDVFRHEGLPAFFKCGGVLPFDPFAASFYLVTRYEEYVPHQKDKHARFPASSSIAKRNGFLPVAVVDRWAKLIRSSLSSRFPSLQFKERKYSFTPTYDVDIAWSYRHKGLLRTIGGYGRSLVRGDFRDMRDRTSGLFGQPDPFFTFDYIDALTDKFSHRPQWFFHLGKRGPFDKSIRASHPQMKKLIRRIAAQAPVGVHPSYGSNVHPERVQGEKQHLESIIGDPVTKSRQHFLVMSMPDTYRRLIQLGITDEYSMGYSSDLGFRAGTCSSFYFYDLISDKSTSLRIHPFAIMDAPMQYFDVKVPAEDVPAFVEPIVTEVKEVQGHLMTLFHNNSFSERDEWIGWRKAYEGILEMAQP